MTIGISKDFLIELRDASSELGDNLRAGVYTGLIHECKELDPQLPIANAPTDKPVLLLLDKGIAVTGYWCIYQWVTDIFDGLDCGSGVTPTHYKLLQDGIK